MKFLNYIRGLAPDMEKADIKNEISDLRQQFKDNVEPTLGKAVEAFASHKFKSKEILSLSTRLNAKLSYRPGNNIVKTIQMALVKVPEKLDMLDSIVEREFGEKIITNGLRYDNANVLRYIEAIGFALNYTRKVLLRILKLETEAISGERDVDEVRYLVEYLEQNVTNFAIVLNVLYDRKENQLKLFEEIPQKRVSEDAEQMMGFKGDPIKMGFLPPKINPIFALLKYRAEIQVRQYKEREYEIEQIQNRLMELKLEREGRKDPHLTQRIEKYENELEKLVLKNRTFEEKYL